MAIKLTRNFVSDVRRLIVTARETVARGVDLVQVHTNFEIGRRIVFEEQRGRGRAAYGEEVIKALSLQLTKEFGCGFSERNLAYMRTFYLRYQDRDNILQTASAKLTSGSKSPARSKRIPAAKISQTVSGKSRSGRKLQTLSAKSNVTRRPSPTPPFTLGWSHYVFLLGIKDPDERRFYEIESASANWTVRELKRQFNSSLFERLALSRDKKGVRRLARKGLVVSRPDDLLKEPLVLDFLGLSERSRYSESDLETAVITRMERFLLEMGKGFLFEARQKRFTFDGENYYVDLVFYNRLLRCYVLVDLKLGKITHQDLGQMQMYVNFFDRYLKAPDENPTIGIVLCKKNQEAMVEITLPKGANIHAREYQLYLPSKEQLHRKLVEWTREAGEK